MLLQDRTDACERAARKGRATERLVPKKHLRIEDVKVQKGRQRNPLYSLSLSSMALFLTACCSNRHAAYDAGPKRGAPGARGL